MRVIPLFNENNILVRMDKIIFENPQAHTIILTNFEHEEYLQESMKPYSGLQGKVYKGIKITLEYLI